MNNWCFDEIRRWEEYELPPLPPDFMWVEYANEPAVVKRGSTLSDWHESPYGWVGENIGQLNTGYVCAGRDQSPGVKLNADTVEECIALVAQCFWMGVFK